ncbi:MAG: right-handed parallel beta-helix repeat-containing protein [Candidatus Nanopelagicales bacterium]|mgnify:CR=1 FL=1|jgi:hypothetical protein
MGTLRQFVAALLGAATAVAPVLPIAAAANSMQAAPATNVARPTLPTQRASGTYQQVDPVRVASSLKVRSGRTATVSFARVGPLARSGVLKVRATVSVRSAKKGSTQWRPRGASKSTTVSFKAKTTKSAAISLPPGTPTGWRVTNRGARAATVSVVIVGYWRAEPPNTGSPPETSPTPGDPVRTIDPSPGPISANGRYDVGTFTGTDLWVNPTAGSDSNSGASRGSALRTVGAAWNRIPRNQTLTTGYRIQLVAGTYPESALVNYWEDRLGTHDHPIILNAADGAHTATFTGGINMFNTHHFYLIGVDINHDGDSFHCEQCSYTLIRNSSMDGNPHVGDGAMAHETIKVNQSDHVYVEDSDIAGADDNAIDFVAVQYGHLRGNRVSRADDWCAYSKGGSAYLTIAENEFYNCGTGGYTAGQGTGIQFTTSPWMYYEAMDIKVVNNIIHDTQGAGLGVNGGYNILLAYNTIYRVGTRSHTTEFVYGSHSCDGASEGGAAQCAPRVNAGGWGTTGDGEALIPNKHVYFYNNVILNPTGVVSSQQFAIYGPRTQDPALNVPNPARTDDDLRIVGNVIWNGNSDTPVGIGDNSGCQPDNATCTEGLITANNQINTTRPDFVDAAGLNFLPVASGWLVGQSAAAIPSFGWTDSPHGSIPSGSTSNSVPLDRAGNARSGWGHPGAY